MLQRNRTNQTCSEHGVLMNDDELLIYLANSDW